MKKSKLLYNLLFINKTYEFMLYSIYFIYKYIYIVVIARHTAVNEK